MRVVLAYGCALVSVACCTFAVWSVVRVWWTTNHPK